MTRWSYMVAQGLRFLIVLPIAVQLGACDNSHSKVSATTGHASAAAVVTLSQERIVAAGGQPNDNFGSAVALEGKFALIGAPVDAFSRLDFHSVPPGSVYVFHEQQGKWMETQTLKAAEESPNNHFGAAIAMAGNTAIIGAEFQGPTHAGLARGAAYIFELSQQGTWSQAAKLAASDPRSTQNFGAAVALSRNVAVVGAPAATVDGKSDHGEAYVFEKGGSGWKLATTLRAQGKGVLLQFGHSVATNGRWILIGAPGATVNGDVNQGMVYFFERDGAGGWRLEQTLTAADGSSVEGFGDSLALDRSQVLISAPSTTVSNQPGQGAVYVFANANDKWVKTQKLVSVTGAMGDAFGSAVAIANGIAIVGAFHGNNGPNEDQQGVTYVFVKDDDKWIPSKQLMNPDYQSGDSWCCYGWSAALWKNTALIGEPFAPINGNYQQGETYYVTGIAVPSQNGGSDTEGNR